jgi:tetratricopeptide (TPR) repeat protein
MAPRRVRARNPFPIILGVLLVVAALAGAGYVYWQTTQTAAATAAASAATATSEAQNAEAETATALIASTTTAVAVDIERRYQAALAFESAGDYEQARAAYRELITSNPGYKDTPDRLKQVNEALAEAYYQQGVAAANAQVWGEAVTAFDEALAVLPNYKDTAALRASAARELSETPTPVPTATSVSTPTTDPIMATLVAGSTTEPTTETAATEVRTPDAATPEATPASTVAVTPPPAETFVDTFDVTMQAGWLPIQPGLAVADGRLVGGAGVITYDPGRSNYTIKASVQQLGKFRIYFRIKTDDEAVVEGYAFNCHYVYGCLWERLADGRIERGLSEWFRGDELFDGKPHVLTLEVNGSDFSVMVDDVPFMSVRDATYRDGIIGVGMYYDSRTERNSAFDSLEVIPR